MMVSCWNAVDHCEYLELHLTACPFFVHLVLFFKFAPSYLHLKKASHCHYHFHHKHLHPNHHDLIGVGQLLSDALLLLQELVHLSVLRHHFLKMTVIMLMTMIVAMTMLLAIMLMKQSTIIM